MHFTLARKVAQWMLRTPRLAAITVTLALSLAPAACTTPDRTAELEAQLADAQAQIDTLNQTLGELEDEHAAEHASAGEANAGTAVAQDDTAAPAVSATGLVYAFAPGKVAVIDPARGQVVAEITEGLEGTEWGDALAAPGTSRIFANDSAGARVVVIDTDTQTVEATIDVGPRPVHAYNPLGGNEIWTHSDEEGAFYVINTETLEVPARVVAAHEDTGHGKLVYDETLGDKAYATNTNDPAVFVIDLAAREVTGVIDVCEGEGGTHAKTYTAGNGYAYFECSALGQVAVVDTSDDSLFGYLDGGGQLFAAPDGSLAVIMNKANGVVQVIDGLNEPAIIAEIPVEGGADKLAFYADGDSLWGFTANTQSPDTAVIDFMANTVVKQVAAGDILRPEGARFLHRNGTVGGGYFITPASGDGVVALVDVHAQRLHAAVPVGPGVNQAIFVGPQGHHD